MVRLSYRIGKCEQICRAFDEHVCSERRQGRQMIFKIIHMSSIWSKPVRRIERVAPAEIGRDNLNRYKVRLDPVNILGSTRHDCSIFKMLPFSATRNQFSLSGK